jgi:hypothetical protein
MGVKMTYRRRHYNCSPGCKIHTAYIRVNKKWKRVGQFYTKCGQFKLDKPLQNEAKNVHEKPKIIVKPIAYTIPQSRVSQISDKELWHLCNSLDRFKGWCDDNL